MPVVYSNPKRVRQPSPIHTRSSYSKTETRFDVKDFRRENSLLSFRRNYNYVAHQLAIGIQTVMQHSFQRILERVLEGIRSWGEGVSASHFHPSYDKGKMEALFHPKTIAVVGASKRENSLGKRLYENLTLLDYKGDVFPVNPKYDEINGATCYDKIEDIDEFIDLVIIITPARTVSQIIRECGEANVKNALILSTGFREIGEKGVEFEADVLLEARRADVRIIGTNSIGFIRPHLNLFATFSDQRPKEGNIGFISQSGAMGEGVLDWGRSQNVGFSAFVSIGGMIDISWGDVIHYLGDDQHTKAIVLYMETINYARSFLSAAKEVSYSKPIIVLKTGKRQHLENSSSKQAISPIHFEVDEDLIFNAAFRRSGMLRVDTMAEVFFMVEVISKQPRPKGKKLAILTNANAPAQLATSMLEKGNGELASLSEVTIEKLSAHLPKHWEYENPLDLHQFATPELYEIATEVLLEDKNVDGLLVVLAPQAVSQPTETAKKLLRFAPLKKKPILVSWMGGDTTKEGRNLLSQAGIPNFQYPDAAAHIFNYLWKYAYNLKGIYQTPRISNEMKNNPPSREIVGQIIANARIEGRGILTEWEAKLILAAYNLPIVDTRLALSEDEAWQQAESIGKPVVLKVYSDNIINKSEVGGVRLYLKDEQAVRNAFQDIKKNIEERVGEGKFLGVTVQEMNTSEDIEMLMGSKVDAQFGSIIFFGNGGNSMQYYEDRAIALPPLNTTLARRAIEQTTIYKNLVSRDDVHEPTLKLLEQSMVRFSQLIIEQPFIKEIYLNPISVSRTEGVSILDAVMVLQPTEVKGEDLIRLAIRPYPSEYEERWVLPKSKQEVLIRPIRPEDEPLMANFHKRLSPQSVYFRFFHAVSLDQRASHERLSRICFADYDRQLTLIIEIEKKKEENEIIGAIRIIKLHGTKEAEFGMTIVDGYQGEGLGSKLLTRAVEVCRSEGIELLTADILPENMAMRKICEKLGFIMEHNADEGTVKASLYIRNIFDYEEESDEEE
ncbi:bifunctional acetate--CoA ligase family protein/GNAT family N-acetyltransferase [Bernardetia sp.]|uniref:bifunctional acetate--CoA ligase family protein/GNAT family N-acetyltransferase n=1 Tax=Bernardetia sp. TaxID=1937974 RepID=UPI0025C01357|nr:bifunctional acetate--CoA ligase family protein/GNAT family N-acetyltransferase [Bernardetia sp.]